MLFGSLPTDKWHRVAAGTPQISLGGLALPTHHLGQGITFIAGAADTIKPICLTHPMP